MKYTAIILIVLISVSCINKGSTQNTIGNFDISANDKQILFSYYSQNGSSIYLMNIDGSDKKQIVSSTETMSYFNPKFSKDDSQIIFIEYEKKNATNCRLCIAKYDGTELEYLTKGNEIITEAIFSCNDSLIIFCKANEFGNYSPLGQKQAHGYDIYSVNIFDGEIRKISKLNSYGMYHISEVDSSVYLMGVSAGPDGGMFLFSRNEPNELYRIVPSNDPRGDASLYYMPTYSKSFNLLAFIAPYQMYIMDLKSQKAKLIFDNVGYSLIDYICYYNTENRILFLKNGDERLYSIQADGTGLQVIDVSPNSFN